MNILLDTNVVLSAALRDRLPEKVVQYIATNASCRWIVTADILREYFEVLARPKFNLPAHLLDQWTALIEMRTHVVPMPSADISIRDQKDAMFLAAAVATAADYLITGDQDVLQAKFTMATRTVTVAEFAAEFDVN